jgi:uncharacterized membrane protein
MRSPTRQPLLSPGKSEGKAMRRMHVSIRIIGSRPRLFSCILLGAMAYFVMPDSWRVASRALVAWNIGVGFYLLLIGWMILRSRPNSIARRAAEQDEGRFFILILSTVSTLASIGAIVVQLASVKDAQGIVKALHIALALSTILSSWLFIHSMYALHYAHEYFFEFRKNPDQPGQLRGGLDFAGGQTPTYGDFLYFAFAIGCAAATSDTNVTTTAMRRMVTVHSILSFFFNTTILALTINIAAGLI